MISSLIFLLLWLAAATLLITAALSPVETLSWWAGWTDRELDDAEPDDAELDDAEPDNDEAPAAGGGAARGDLTETARQTYVVYLSGVASLTGAVKIPRERRFITALRKARPDAVIVDEVFPYSPAGLPLLASPRIFERLWRRIQATKLKGRHGFLSFLINIRNIFQVMVSADHRYGPIFNQGAAGVIEDALLRAGYIRGGGARIVIIGYSGGAQVAIGAAGFLKARLGVAVDVVSIGGVMASDPGLHFVRRLYHLHGDGDHVQHIGAVMFPERWRAMAHSEWNRARREGRIVMMRMDEMIHAGPRGYFGLPKTKGVSNNEKGVSNNERTLETVAAIIGDEAIADTPA